MSVVYIDFFFVIRTQTHVLVLSSQIDVFFFFLIKFGYVMGSFAVA